MISAHIVHGVPEAWRDAPLAVIGREPSGGDALGHCSVCFTTPTRRGRIVIHVDGDEYCFREDVLVVGSAIFVGAAERVAIVDADSLEAREVQLDSYFGYFTALPRGVLVASGRSLYRVELNGRVRWHCADLGIDGVLVTVIDNGVVGGEAELDPPGGWKPFRVDLETGAKVR